MLETSRIIRTCCTLSADGSYVVSVVKSEEAVENVDAPDTSLMAERTGYVLSGWATAPEATEVTYAVQDLPNVPEGTVLYAVWTPAE